jgi:hypothetical protein
MMKRIITILGIAILVTAIVFGFTACPNPTGGGNSGEDDPCYLGLTPTLSGQVYVYSYESDTYSPYTGGTLTVYDPYEQWTGTITDGQFSITLGTPEYLYPFDEDFIKSFPYDYTGVTVSPNTAQQCLIDRFYIKNSSSLLKMEYITDSSNEWVHEYIYYVYVDQDLSITGEGSTYIDDGYSYILEDLNLGLKAGWNTLLGKYEESEETETISLSFSLANPGHLKWLLQEGME